MAQVVDSLPSKCKTLSSNSENKCAHDRKYFIRCKWEKTRCLQVQRRCANYRQELEWELLSLEVRKMCVQIQNPSVARCLTLSTNPHFPRENSKSGSFITASFTHSVISILQCGFYLCLRLEHDHSSLPLNLLCSSNIHWRLPFCICSTSIY